jgi:DNA polymerase III alpha subunit (gram-positive type)
MSQSKITFKKRKDQPMISQAMRKRPVAAPVHSVKEYELDATYHPTELIAAYDLETTGLISDEYCRITDICVTVDPKIGNKIDPSVVSVPFESLVNPGVPIPENITTLTGLADEDVKNADDTKTALTKLNTYLGSLNASYNLPANNPICLTAHGNFNFDQVVLQLEYARCDLQLPANIRFADSYHTIKTHFRHDWKEHLGLQSIYRKVLNKPGWIQPHRARADVNALLDILHHWTDMQDMYQLLIQDYQGPYTLSELNKKIKDIKERDSYNQQSKAKHNNNNKKHK